MALALFVWFRYVDFRLMYVPLKPSRQYALFEELAVVLQQALADQDQASWPLTPRILWLKTVSLFI